MNFRQSHQFKSSIWYRLLMTGNTHQREGALSAMKCWHYPRVDWEFTLDDIGSIDAPDLVPLSPGPNELFRWR